MMPFLDFLWALGHWNWLIAAGILLLLEFVVPGVHLIWFGLAAALTGAVLGALSAAGLGDALSVPVQLILFVGLSIMSLFMVKALGISASPLRTDAPSLNIRGAQYIGRDVTVEDAIVNGRGRVRVDDGVWGAEGEDAPRGSKVRVTGVNGTVLVVANGSED